MSLMDQMQGLRQKLAQQRLTEAQTGMMQQQIKQMPSVEALRQAQIDRLEAQAKTPGGGQPLQGAAAAALSLDMIKQRYGENSPVYQNALKGFQAKIRQENARSLYYSANVQFKNMPNLQRIQTVSDYQNWAAKEQKNGRQPMPFQDWLATRYANIQATTGPSTGVYGTATPASPQPVAPQVTQQAPVSLASPQNLAQAYTNWKNQQGAPAAPTTTGAGIPQAASLVPHQQAPQAGAVAPQQPQVQPVRDYGQAAAESELAKIKAIAPPTIYNLAVQTQATLRTMDRVPASIFKYAGIVGRGKAALLRAQEQGDVLPADAVRYQTFVNEDVPGIADQMRQAFGASTTPEINKMLRNMTNPITWKNNPQVALSSWKELHSMLDDRYKTYLQYAPLGEAKQTAGQIPDATSAAKGMYSTRLKRIVTQKDLNDTVKASGKSLAQVKQDFGIR
jgi:hypothetical protein